MRNNIIKVNADENLKLAMSYSQTMLEAAISDINSTIKIENFAQNNPALLGSYLQAASNIYNSFVSIDTKDEYKELFAEHSIDNANALHAIANATNTQ